MANSILALAENEYVRQSITIHTGNRYWVHRKGVMINGTITHQRMIETTERRYMYMQRSTIKSP